MDHRLCVDWIQPYMWIGPMVSMIIMVVMPLMSMFTMVFVVMTHIRLLGDRLNICASKIFEKMFASFKFKWHVLSEECVCTIFFNLHGKDSHVLRVVKVQRIGFVTNPENIIVNRRISVVRL